MNKSPFIDSYFSIAIKAFYSRPADRQIMENNVFVATPDPVMQ